MEQPGRVRAPIRVVLLAGFGGLLALLAFAGLDTLEVVHEIEQNNNAIRTEFLDRNRTLNEIRSSLYLSGTYLRDYLLDPDVGQAESHKATLERTRAAMDAALTEYRRRIRDNERAPFERLQHALAEYWTALNPVLTWTPEERRARGDAFLRAEVYPRRTSMLAIADQIANVNERQLNDGDRRLADLFDAFRRRVRITILSLMAVGLLLAAVSMSHTLRLEEEAHARFLEIERARQELRDLSARLVETQEAERRAISRELHDEVGQTLSAIVVELSNFSAALPLAAGPALRAHVDTVRKLVESTMGVVRNMALLLRPSMLDDIGLVPALRWQAREVSRRTGIRVDLATGSLPDELPEEHKTCIYRVAQEALHNCARHADAHVCRITLSHENGELLLAVQDDGKGFDRTERGLGLLGIQERAERLHGRFEVNSVPGRGTLLTVALPLVVPVAEPV